MTGFATCAPARAAAVGTSSSRRADRLDRLALRASCGDRDALAALIDGLDPVIRGTASQFRVAGQPADLDDFAQEARIKLLRVMPRFDPTRGVRFAVWANVIVANLCRDLMRARRRRAAAPPGEAHAAGVAESPACDPARTAERSEFSAAVDTALSGIRGDYRRVFELRERQGLDYRDIAWRIGVAVGTVKSRMHRARQALRNALAEFAPGAP